MLSKIRIQIFALAILASFAWNPCFHKHHCSIPQSKDHRVEVQMTGRSCKICFGNLVANRKIYNILGVSGLFTDGSISARNEVLETDV